MASAALVFGVMMAYAFSGSEATDFLDAQRRGERVTKEAVEQILLMEQPGSANDARLAILKDQLRTPFAALPKNERGLLEPSTVRYVLHRHFVQNHGWHVKGLDPEGDGWKASSLSPTADVMKGLAPTYIQELFTEKSNGNGLDLEDLAVFAATIDDLIFQEGLGGLRDAYVKLQFSTSELVAEDQFDMAIRAFLSDLISGDYGVFNRKEDFPALEAKARHFLPEYDDVVMWFRDLFSTQNFLASSQRNPFAQATGVSFDQAGEFLHKFLHNFGALGQDECRTLKEDLMVMEQPGTGRVLLSDFYKNKDLQLQESVDYLRNLGALENESGTPMLMLSNYVSSPSRCTPFSSYYSVCCADECDGLMGSLERDIGHPNAMPSRIAELVSAMPSDTVDAPRNLSTALVSRLDEIAGHHGGLVPLHGRLFLQWMHHAYPRECQFPHAAGTTKPVTQDEWLRMYPDLFDAMATLEESSRHIGAEPLAKPLNMEDLPWSAVEELVAVHKVDPGASGGYLRIMVCVMVLMSFAMPLMRASSALVGRQPKDKTTHFV